ncbi:WYL domain-containing protein [bacterium]|nr:WYL domain-containing protein [bacterium]
MSRKGKSITLSISERDKAELEALALTFGMTWGDRPNISKLIEAIARQQLKIAPNHDWSKQRIAALNRVRMAAIDTGETNAALEIARLLLERGELTIPLRQELERYMAEPMPPWRLEIDRYLQRQHPFQLSYQDATERVWNFTVRYAEITKHDKRQYLDCWCEETTNNQDLTELAHNWCLRLDRITDAAVSSAPGKWQGQLDAIEVELHLFGRLAFAYESKTANDVINQWHSELPQTRQLIRQVSNTFWLIREILPYGQDCEVITPDSVRAKIADEIRALSHRYGI